MATDTNGTVYVTGLSYGIDTIYDYVTLAYSSAGEPLWTNRYDGWASDRDVPCAIAVNSSGIVFVTGTSQTGPGTSEYMTVAYSSAGTLLWVNSYAGLGNGGNDAHDLAVDSHVDVVVTGGSSGSAHSTESATIKYSSNGSPLWTNLYIALPGVADDAANGLAIDQSGNVYVTGSSGTGTGWTCDCATIKYSSAGVPLWTNYYHGPVAGTESGCRVALDSNGNAFVLSISPGRSGNPSYDYATIKYSSGGPDARGPDILLDFVRRDLNAGIRQGRFKRMPIELALNIVAGSVLGATHCMLEPDCEADFAEQTAAAALRALGVDAKSAERIATRPLQAVETLPEGLLADTLARSQRRNATTRPAAPALAPRKRRSVRRNA